MRLAILNQFYKPDISPTAQLCASLAEHRAAKGDRVTVLTSRSTYRVAVASKESAAGVRVRRLWSTRFGSRSKHGRLFDWASFYLPAFWAALTMGRQDVFIILTTPPFIGLAGWLHKLIHPTCRLILWNMDVYPEALERAGMARPTSLVSRVMRSANRAIFRRLDRLICLDEAMRELLLSQYSPPARAVPCTVIPNWEPADFFPPPPPSPPANAFDPELPPDLARKLQGKFVILYMGNAGYGHEFQTALAAAEMLRDEPVVFAFVGGGALRPWIAKERDQRHLRNVILHDYVPRKEQTRAIMSRADIALITLDTQMGGVMSPSKLHANLAMGLPIAYVGPPGSNVDTAITRFSCGISLRPQDAEGLTQFIRHLMKTPLAHTHLRQAARRAFDTAYCDTTTLPEFDAVLDSQS